MRSRKFLMVILILGVGLLSLTGCDLGTYESRFDEHFEGRLELEIEPLKLVSSSKTYRTCVSALSI